MGIYHTFFDIIIRKDLKQARINLLKKKKKNPKKKKKKYKNKNKKKN